MADGIQVEVRGASNLTRTALGAAREFRDLTETNRRAANLVATAASPPRRTGRLASSIEVLNVSATEGTVGSGLVYAPVIEYGWAAHGIEARHFLTDALGWAAYAVEGLYADRVAKVLSDVKGV